VAVFPLVAKKELTKVATKIHSVFKENGFISLYDDADSIGRRYARVDEIGVPYAVTIDFDTLNDNTVTIRERDTTKQVRMKIEKLPEILKDLLEEKVEFKEL
jgi:glycyl-tRNA synthetase